MKNIASKEIEIYKKQFRKLVLTEGADEKLIERYSIANEIGYQIYKSFTDKELLEILRKKAQLLNHTPSQKEVPKVFKEYIKTRFEKWPYALKEAGLSKAAGSGGKTLDKIKEENAEKKKLIEELQKITENQGYIPHPHQVPEISEKLKKYATSWGDIVKEAGLDTLVVKNKKLEKERDLDRETKNLLLDIKEQAYKVGRAPLKSEIATDKKDKLLKAFGSWRNVLFQIDLEPVKRIKPFANTFIDYRKKTELGKHNPALTNCLYRVLNLTDQDKMDLAELKNLADARGGKVEKKDVPKELKKRLVASCGTWTNALWQIGIDSNNAAKSSKKRL